jgi:hypothetical protein
MSDTDIKYFHKLYGVKKPRIAFQKSDFIDYAIMIAICACVIVFSYGPRHLMSILGIGLCAAMIVAFPLRHGCEFAAPIILRRPQDLLFMLVYKVRNMTGMYLFAVAVLLLQSYLVYLTPNLPHHVALMRSIALGLFYLHFGGISVYRTVCLVAHLRKQELIHEVLLQTAWKGQITQRSVITGEIVHAYFTGLLTHIVLIAPWYIAITYCKFSLLFLPALVAINIFTHLMYLKSYNGWFYRDHWLGHNSELEFIYLHGTHHDAIPSGLIGVSGNGFLEGFMRHTLGHPTPYYHPIVAFLLYTLEVQSDIQNHQYIPGIFPKLSRGFHETCQHSTHHYGRLEPYSVGLRCPPGGADAPAKKRFQIIPEEILNSIALDERLTGFDWENYRYKKFLDLFDKYQG